MTESLLEASAQLRAQILPDAFEVIIDPLGWRCRSCRTEVLAGATDTIDTADRAAIETTINRLAESAADHTMFCGRCDD